MPKIRHYKDWTYAEDLSFTGQESGIEDDPLCSASGEATTGQSYLSNANVIASLPDDRLKSAAHRYRQLYLLCNEELRVRQLTGRGPAPIAWPDMFGLRPQLRRARKAKTRHRTQLSEAELMCAAQMLDELAKIRKESKLK